MKVLVGGVFVVMFGFVTSVTLVFAQQSSNTTIDQSSEQASSAETKKKQSKKTKSKERVFKPSEEISEDLPVPFPVDI